METRWSVDVLPRSPRNVQRQRSAGVLLKRCRVGRRGWRGWCTAGAADGRACSCRRRDAACSEKTAAHDGSFRAMGGGGRGVVTGGRGGGAVSRKVASFLRRSIDASAVRSSMRVAPAFAPRFHAKKRSGRPSDRRFWLGFRTGQGAGSLSPTVRKRTRGRLDGFAQLEAAFTSVKAERAGPCGRITGGFVARIKTRAAGCFRAGRDVPAKRRARSSC